MPVTRAPLTPYRIATGVGGYTFVTPPLGTPNTVTLTQSTLFAQPWFVPNAVTVTEVGVNLAAAVGSSLVRQGFYADSGNYYPGNLILDCGINSGTINGNQSAGYYNLVLNTPLTLPPGIYWAATVSQGAAASVRGATTGISWLLSSTLAFASLSQPPWTAFNNTGVTGAMPATFVTTRTVNTGGVSQFLVRIL